MNLQKNLHTEREQILVVEDSPTQAEQLRYRLEQKAYRVTLAGNGKEALTLLADYRPALVISDVVMPDMGLPVIFFRREGYVASALFALAGKIAIPATV